MSDILALLTLLAVLWIAIIETIEFIRAWLARRALDPTRRRRG